MKIRVNTDLVLGIITALFALVVLLMIPHHIAASRNIGIVDSRFFPRLLASLILILSAVQVIQSVTVAKKRKFIEIDFGTQGRAVITMLLMVGCAIATRFVGIIIPGVIAAWGMLIVTRSKNWKHYLAVLIIGIALFFAMRDLLNLRMI